MKNLLLTMMLLSTTAISMAKEIDLETAKGTDQGTIVSLSPIPASLTVDENQTLQVFFNIDLDASHVKKNDIKLQQIADTVQLIDGEVSYDETAKAVIFDPTQPLEIGYYEVEFKSLKATKANKDTQIQEIKYRFYVPEVINGHKLPPEPDAEKNSATLEGVDMNDNGVRDDVERSIYKKYTKKLHSTLLMDNAKIYQRTMIEPTSNALIIQKDVSKVIDCKIYLGRLDEDIRLVSWRDNRKSVKNLTFNNRDRVRKYLDYNLALSGGSYGSSMDDVKREICSQEIVNVLEEMGL